MHSVCIIIFFHYRPTFMLLYYTQLDARTEPPRKDVFTFPVGFPFPLAWATFGKNLTPIGKSSHHDGKHVP